jgi:cyclophilin family peptidyl-prolyl cis-trans isomerase
MRHVKLTAALLAMGILFLKGTCSMAAESNQVTGANSNSMATNQDRKATMAVTDEVAVIETKFGSMVIEFYDKNAPKTVANFKKLAKEGFYNGTTFHRVIPGFMIQGGDPNSKNADRSAHGTGGPGYTVPAEIKRDHQRGTVATARLGDQMNPEKASSGSQFFINVNDNVGLNGGYTVFGNVIAGMDVADKIVNVPRDRRDNPNEPVVMTKVTITTRVDALKK